MRGRCEGKRGRFEGKKGQVRGIWAVVRDARGRSEGCEGQM